MGTPDKLSTLPDATKVNNPSGIHIELPDKINATGFATVTAQSLAQAPKVLQGLERTAQAANSAPLNPATVTLTGKGGAGVLGLLSHYFGNAHSATDLAMGGAQGANTTAAVITSTANNALPLVPHAPKAVNATVSAVKSLAGRIKGGVAGGTGVVVAGEEVAVATAGATAAAEEITAIGRLAPAVNWASSIKMGAVGAVLTTGVSYFEYRAATNAGDGYRQARAVGTGSGAVAGIATTTALSGQVVAVSAAAATATTTFLASTEAGAAIGTAIPIPVVGTVVGAAVGAIIGGLIVWGMSSAGKKIAEKAVGEKWQQQMDAKTRAEQDAEMGQLKGMGAKFESLGAMGTAEASLVAAVKTNDIAAIEKAKADYAAASTSLANFQGLTKEEGEKLAKIKADLVKDYVNEKGLQIPASDHAALERRAKAMEALGKSVASIDALVKIDAEVKAKLTPDARKEILEASTKASQVADKRIVEIHHQEANGAQQSFQQHLAKTVKPLGKFETASPTLAKIAELNTAIAAGTVPLAEGKQRLTQLNAQEKKEELEIAHVQALLAKERKEQVAKLKDKYSGKFAANNIKAIDALNANINSFKENYAQTDDLTKQTMQTAEAAQQPSPARTDADLVQPKQQANGQDADPMRSAMNQAREGNVASGLADARETTQRDHDPVRERVAMDRALPQAPAIQAIT